MINHNASNNIMLFELKPRITKFEHTTHSIRRDGFTTGRSSDGEPDARQRVMYIQDERTNCSIKL